MSCCFKAKVLIELKAHGPTECFAVFPKQLFHLLHRTLPETGGVSYTKEIIHAQLKVAPD